MSQIPNLDHGHNLNLADRSNVNLTPAKRVYDYTSMRIKFGEIGPNVSGQSRYTNTTGKNRVFERNR